MDHSDASCAAQSEQDPPCSWSHASFAVPALARETLPVASTHRDPSGAPTPLLGDCVQGLPLKASAWRSPVTHPSHREGSVLQGPPAVC